MSGLEEKTAAAAGVNINKNTEQKTTESGKADIK
jgi:hypothetical protein